MKRILILILLCSFTAYSQNGEINRLTGELQKNPSDRALRERIIKLVLEAKPAPAVPREATEIEGAAEYIASSAKSEADFAKAAAEFEKAATIAPWIAADYYNAAVMYEKAKMPERALPNYELYLLAAPNAQDSAAVIKKIGAMKFAVRSVAEERNAAEQAARDRAAEQDLISRVQGVHFMATHTWGGNYNWVENRRITFRNGVGIVERDSAFENGKFKRVPWTVLWRCKLVGRRCEYLNPDASPYATSFWYTIVDDNTVEVLWKNKEGSTGTENPYRRP